MDETTEDSIENGVSNTAEKDSEESDGKRSNRRVPPPEKKAAASKKKASALPVEPEPEESHDYYNDAAGVYAPLLELRNKRELDEIPVVPLPPRTIGGLRDQIEKSKQCNCRRSHCLKLYCECFATGIHCSDLCNCVSCKNKNVIQANRDRYDSILMTLERNAHAFRPRIIAMSGAAASVTGGSGLIAIDSPHKDSTTTTATTTLASLGGAHSMTGCNCKKSFCLKKYCECFHAAVYCNPPHCRCTDCQNHEGNPERERLVAKRRSQAQAAAAAAALAHQHSRLAHISGRMMGDAGRTYYGAEHSSGTPKSGDTDVSTAAAAMAAGAAAGGVDVFLPPSSYAVPMQLKNGTSYAALSFGTAGPRRVGQSAADAAEGFSSPSRTTGSNNTTPRKKRRFANVDPSATRETELETALRYDVERVKATFEEVRHRIQRESSPETRLFPPSTNGSTSSSVYGNQLADNDDRRQREEWIKRKSEEMKVSVERDLTGLVRAWKEAEPWAKERMAKDSKQEAERDAGETETATEQMHVSQLVVRNGDAETHGNAQLKDDSERDKEKYHSDNNASAKADGSDVGSSKELKPTSNGGSEVLSVDVTHEQLDSESALFCQERIDTQEESASLSDAATRELTILAAQDAALLRELAQRVRQKALEMAQQRVRFVAEAMKKSS